MRWGALLVIIAATSSAGAALVAACANYLDADAGVDASTGDGTTSNDAAPGEPVGDASTIADGTNGDGPSTDGPGPPIHDGSTDQGAASMDGSADHAPPPMGDAACNTSYATMVVEAGPTLYLRFDDPDNASTAADTMGHYPGAYPQAGITYQVPGAIVSDPCDKAIDISIDPQMAAQGGIVMPPSADFAAPGAQFSVELWIDPEADAGDTQSGGIGFVIDHDRPPPAARAGWDLVYLGATGQPETAQLELWSADGGIFGVANPLTTPYPTPGCWHYVVATYDGTNDTPTLWIDGTNVFDQPVVGGVLSVVDAGWTIGWQNCIGSGTPCTGTNYVGGIDELAIYPRLLLGAEITSHWQAANAATCP
jgi:Concanavalin A-like lectin/glucanases superfamily